MEQAYELESKLVVLENTIILHESIIIVSAASGKSPYTTIRRKRKPSSVASFYHVDTYLGYLGYEFDQNASGNFGHGLHGTTCYHNPCALAPAKSASL
jgi:hypothetical protein